MANDTPQAKAGTPRMLALRKVAGGAAMRSDSGCRCHGDEDTLPLAVAIHAIQGSSVPAEMLFDYRRRLRAVTCFHERVTYRAMYDALKVLVDLPIWGAGRRSSLVDDVAADVRRALGFAAMQDHAELLGVVASLVHQGTGGLSLRVAYDPLKGKTAARPPSLRSFVKSRALRRMRRVLAMETRRVPLETEGDADDTLPRSATLGPNDLRRLSVLPVAEGEIDVLQIHAAFRDAGALIGLAAEVELLLLDVLEDLLGGLRLTDFQRRKRATTLAAMRRGILGEDGHCVMLDSRIGVASDAPPIPIATKISAAVGRDLYASSNAAKLNEQFAGWVDELFGIAANHAGHAVRARGFATVALRRRALAHRLLDALADVFPLIGDSFTAERIAEWRGPPGRDRTDANNGTGGVHGVGIAHVPFLFGLVDPLADETHGLIRLLADARED